MSRAEGERMELDWETIGRTGGKCVYALCILGIP